MKANGWTLLSQQCTQGSDRCRLMENIGPGAHGMGVRASEVRDRPPHPPRAVCILVVKRTLRKESEGILSSVFFQFQTHHPWASYKQWLERPRQLKRPIRNSDKDVSLGPIMVGILKLLWLWKLKTLPSTPFRRVRKAAWETSLDKSYHCFFPPWILVGRFKTACRNGYQNIEINTHIQT